MDIGLGMLKSLTVNSNTIITAIAIIIYGINPLIELINASTLLSFLS